MAEVFEDSVAVTDDQGVPFLAVRNDTGATKTGTDGDYSMVSCDPAGRVDVSTRSTVISVTPAVSTTPAYSPEDGVGSVYDFASAFGAARLSGTITNVTIVDTSKQNAAMTIFFFNTSPAAGLSSDNAALSVGATLMTDNCVGQVSVSASDYSSTALASVATKLCSLSVKSLSTSLWAVMKTTGTPTYASVSALRVKLGIQQD
jgi:hypothetical protein